MSADADDPLAEQLRALRREYLADSTLRVEELRGLFGRLSNGDQSALPQFRQALHRLAGSGGSYGFPAVSERSRAGEQLAGRIEAAGAALLPADLEALGACLDGVARAFADARERAGPT